MIDEDPFEPPQTRPQPAHQMSRDGRRGARLMRIVGTRQIVMPVRLPNERGVCRSFPNLAAWIAHDEYRRQHTHEVHDLEPFVTPKHVPPSAGGVNDGD